MCIFTKQKTISEIIAEKAAGMTDAEKSTYASEIDQIVFEKLLKVNVTLYSLTADEWWDVMLAKYPTLERDSEYEDDPVYYTVSVGDMERVIALDWTNLRTYITNKLDCEDFAGILATRLVAYYGITAIKKVLGQTTNGPHGWNTGPLVEDGTFAGKQLEPQSDVIFDVEGPLGTYTPKELK